VQEFVEGCKINDVESIEKMGLKPKECAEILVDVFSKMIF